MAVPWSLMSPVSTMKSMSNCLVIDRITSHEPGLMCRSDTNSTRIVDELGANAGTVDVTSYSRETFVTIFASCFSYF